MGSCDKNHNPQEREITKILKIKSHISKILDIFIHFFKKMVLQNKKQIDHIQI